MHRNRKCDNYQGVSSHCLKYLWASRISETCGRDGGQEGSQSPECHVIKITGGKLVDLKIRDTLREETAMGFRLIKKKQSLDTFNVGFKSMGWLTRSPHRLASRQLVNQRVKDNIQRQFLYLYSTFKWVAPGPVWVIWSSWILRALSSPPPVMHVKQSYKCKCVFIFFL